MKELKCLFVLEMGCRLLLGLPGSLAALPGSGRGHRAGVPTSGSAPPAAGTAGRRLPSPPRPRRCLALGRVKPGQLIPVLLLPMGSHSGRTGRLPSVKSSVCSELAGGILAAPLPANS